MTSRRDRPSYCAGCHKRIEDTLVTAINSKWHKKCFVCFRCKCPLANVEFIVDREQAFCSKCSEEVCAGCGHVIESLTVTTLGDKKYHERCMKCCVCRRRIPSTRTTVLVIDGQPYCEEDYNLEKSIRSRGRSGLSGPSVCAGCHKGLDGESVKALDRKWHPKCFVCTACRTPFSSQFVTVEGRPYCNECAEHICDVCHEVVDGEFVRHEGKVLHKNCFVCHKCKRPVDINGFYNRDGRVYCKPDFLKLKDKEGI